ncbi:MAG: hypothetical protein IMF19_09385 [Proteobacteria bacterium]|jgi:hypothetical protein|nr:hypothetical protein [Pseudomonadota bacterium]
MSTVEEAKKKLRKAEEGKDVWEVIKEAISNLICLKIETKVIGGTDGSIITEIDLLQADRKNEIHINFLKDPVFAPLRDFHTEQVKLAEQDIQKKLEFLQNMANVLVGWIKPVEE